MITKDGPMFHWQVIVCVLDLFLSGALTANLNAGHTKKRTAEGIV